MNIDPSDISVKIKLANNTSGKMLAQAEVDFGVIRTQGWQIIRSRFTNPETGKDLFISPPNYRGHNGSWYPIVYVDDHVLYETVSSLILNEYLIAIGKPETDSPDQSDIDLDEVDQGINEQILRHNNNMVTNKDLGE